MRAWKCLRFNSRVSRLSLPRLPWDTQTENGPLRPPKSFSCGHPPCQPLVFVGHFAGSGLCPGRSLCMTLGHASSGQPTQCTPRARAKCSHGHPWAAGGARALQGRSGSSREKPFGYGSKLNHQENRRFWSMCPLTRVPVGVPIFDPQPFEHFFGMLNGTCSGASSKLQSLELIGSHKQAACLHQSGLPKSYQVREPSDLDRYVLCRYMLTQPPLTRG